MKRIKLTQGKWALVSDCDYEYLNQFKWCISNEGYVKRGAWIKKLGKQYTQLMHRIVAERMGLDLSLQVDHINRNKSDNQRENLRSATQSQQRMNCGVKVNNTSGLTGVYWHKRNQKWCIKIGVKGDQIYLGSFDTKEEAYKARCKAVKKYHGEFACE